MATPYKTSAANRARSKRYYLAHREKQLAYNKKYRAEHPGQGRDGNSRAQRKHIYGLTEDQFQSLVEASNGVCAICQKPFASSRDRNIDHDHKTGRIRGLLCRKCNISLAALENEVFWVGAQRYLSRLL